MGSRICMNNSCGVKTTVQWKKAWELKSGETADLCYNCGSAYDNRVYCDTFHAKETGWRECSLCNKRLHCGCSASSHLFEIQDLGGVLCTNCVKNAPCHLARSNGVSSEAQTYASDVQNSQFSVKREINSINNGNLLNLNNIIETNVPKYLPKSPPELTSGSLKQITPEPTNPLAGVGGSSFLNPSNTINGPSLYPQSKEDKSKSTVKDMQESKMPSLNISLCSPSKTSNVGLSFSSGVEEGENSRSTLFHSGQKPRQILPKPPKQNVVKAQDVNKSSFSPMRATKPPAEGRLRNQLLPRYLPKITDEELQKLSGDLNSKIVPLFEKILSASDASRIGRLVLPKACAEAYFPTINQSEGLPLKVRDIKGNDWTFQFRFWPNNNSRMYVLEGITPCIQAMQLQAGDIVTFSQIVPGGKLVIGYRKASNTEIQDPQPSSTNPNSGPTGDSSNADVADTLSAKTGQFGQKSTESAKEEENPVNGNSKEKMKSKVNEDVLEKPEIRSNKKRTRKVGFKSKRLDLHNDDVKELRLTWEETQGLLCPPSSVDLNIVVVDDFEIEEYNEPPVIGKRTFFTTRRSGGKKQWTQCDKCSKWRKLPSDFPVPPKWECSDNIWDSTRSSCSSSEEKCSKELGNIIKKGKDSKKQKVSENPNRECDPSGLDALATAATLGDHPEPSTGPTTRHPRHRPGCTCIVCIQPPSGKGKHKPSCVCNVCLTVKRRFKTLMMRKKEREATQMDVKETNKQQTEEPGISKRISGDDPVSNMDHDVENEQSLEESESSKSLSHIDLNSHPVREEDGTTLDGQPSVGTRALARVVSGPLDMYVKPNGLANKPVDGGEGSNGPAID